MLLVVANYQAEMQPVTNYWAKSVFDASTASTQKYRNRMCKKKKPNLTKIFLELNKSSN